MEEYQRMCRGERSLREALSSTVEELFPDIPYWGEMLTEADDAVGFGFTYIDEHNKLFN